MNDETAGRAAPAPRWHGWLVGLVALIVYAPAWNSGYVLDGNLIADKQQEFERAPLSTLFDGRYFELYHQDTYRPVVTVTSMVEHRLGVDPCVAGRVQNSLWHAGTAVLLRAFAGELLAPGPALAAALTYAVHPVASEANLCLGFREDLLVAFFVLAALLMTLDGRAGPRAVAHVCYLLALLSKENAVVFPALLLLARLTVVRPPDGDRWAIAREVAGFVLTTVGYLVVRFALMSSPARFADPVGGSWGASFVAAPRILAHDLRLFVVPWPLLAQYNGMFPLGASWLSQIPWIALDVAVIAGALWLARARPPIGFGLLWYLVALTPTLHIVPMRVEAAVRFVHLSIIGGAIAFGGVLQVAELERRRPAVRLASAAALGAAFLALLLMCERRVPVWRSDVTLWADTLRHNEHAYMGHSVIAQWREEHGDLPGARRAIAAALRDCPQESAFGRQRFCAPYAFMLGRMHLRFNDVQGAREAFIQSGAFAKDYVPSIIGLGYLDLLEHRLDEARQRADRGVRLSPVSPQIRALLRDYVRSVELAELHRRGAVGVAAPP